MFHIFFKFYLFSSASTLFKIIQHQILPGPDRAPLIGLAGGELLRLTGDPLRDLDLLLDLDPLRALMGLAGGELWRLAGEPDRLRPLIGLAGGEL